MGRLVDVDQLVGAAEIAQRLGMKRHQVVHDWVRRYPEFPSPVVLLRQAKIWYWPEVAEWADATGRHYSRAR
jgi:predicted DNA-binding transcriptional regulator AlpA